MAMKEDLGDGTLRSSKRPDPGRMVDSRDAAELLQVFLAGRRYGVSQTAAIDAAGRCRNGRLFSPGARAGLGSLALVM